MTSRPPWQNSRASHSPLWHVRATIPLRWRRINMPFDCCLVGCGPDVVDVPRVLTGAR
jgi:hypothetical protein